MGSFQGHVLPGSLFLLAGLWHVWSTVARFVSDPGGFRVRVWNPVGSGRMRHLELYVVTGGALLDMCIELLYATHLKLFVGRERILNPSHMNDFEHGGMLLMFFLFGAAALLSEKTRFITLPEEALSLLASTAFSAEFLLFYFHSTTHKGLEGHYHFLLVILIGFCVISTILGSLFSTNFTVDLAIGISITLQGLWFYQTAFTLYGPTMPRGCHLDAVNSSVKCVSQESEVRGEILANFQMFTIIFVMFVVVVGAYVAAAKLYGHPQLKTLIAADVDREERDEEVVAL